MARSAFLCATARVTAFADSPVAPGRGTKASLSPPPLIPETQPCRFGTTANLK